VTEVLLAPDRVSSTISEGRTSQRSAAEICQVFDNEPVFRRNKSGRTADYVAIGVTRGGSRVRVNFIYDLARRTARPVSAWRLS
jgi:hypothetical protein